MKDELLVCINEIPRELVFNIHIWVRFPRTGIMAKMWSFFLKVEPSCDQTLLYIFDFSIDPGQLCPLHPRNTLTWPWKIF